MNLKKREFLLQSTERGQIGWMLGPFFLLFIGIVLCACLQVRTFRASAQYMEDALAASGLAAAVIDVEEYGISHRIRIENPESSFERYCEALRENLNLNREWECPNKSLISGPVRVDTFTVYNVMGDDVEIYSVVEGERTVQQGKLGSVRTPEGIIVEATGIYSEISYDLRGLLGVKVRAHKGKLVDVVRNE